MPGTPSSARYRSLRRLAAGGMGEVELAIRREGGFQRFYAIKHLRPELRDDEMARRMFVDEARLSGLIQHPNVVSVLDVGEDDRGPFLVMDFVEGISAGVLLKWASSSSIMLPVQLCLRIAREVAVGLHAAHELRDPKGRHLELVHRDVSPQNILIGFDGISRIADFGIAKAEGRTTKTTTGLLKGKAGYMAPEQLRFEDPDRRTDVFSLGVVLYELLAGTRLYKAETDIIAARRILNEEPPDIDDVRDDVPPAVVDLLFRVLAKDPETRPASAHAVAATLESSLASLIDVDGGLDVGEYLRDHFHDRAEVIRDLRASVRTELTLTPPQEIHSQGPVVDGAKPRTWMPRAAIGLVGIALLAGGWFAFAQADEPAAALEPAAQGAEVPAVQQEEELATEAAGPVRVPVPPSAESESGAPRERAADPPRRRRRGSPMGMEDSQSETPNEAALFDWAN